MSRKDLIEKLKERNPKLNYSDLEEIVDIFSKEIENAMKSNHNIELRGFGTFFIKKIKEKYSARNPKTGEKIYIPVKNKVRFRAAKKLREFINK